MLAHYLFISDILKSQSNTRMIQSIEIGNVKGFGIPARKLTLDLKSNRINICCAPNGFGKSSLAAALKLVGDCPTKLSIPKNVAHRNDETLSPIVKLTVDGNEFVADSTRNEIRRNIECIVINSKVDVSTKQQNLGKFTHVEGVLDIADVIAYEKIPAEIGIVYSVRGNRKDFGRNGKILSNLKDVFSDFDFLTLLNSDECKDMLNSILRVNLYKKSLPDLIGRINDMDGSAVSIQSEIDAGPGMSGEFLNHPSIEYVLDKFGRYAGNSLHSKIDFIIQLLDFFKDNKSNLDKIVKRLKYLRFKDRLEHELDRANSTWLPIKVVEENGKLLVRYPNATQLSNGQRDSLTFLVELIRVVNEVELHPNRKFLIVIDEVFDYLDDANTIVAQFFLSEMKRKFAGKVYLCVLTHLSRFSFSNYVFKDGDLNFVYLQDCQPAATDPVLAFIMFRESLDKSIRTERDLYDRLSSHLFHYNPATVDLSREIQESRHKNNKVKASWGRTRTLKCALIDEVNKYLSSDSGNYDPYAVCMAIRHRVEKLMYDRLPAAEQKNEFLNIHMSRKKFEYCDSVGVEVPDTYNMLTSFHSEADHVKWDSARLKVQEKPIVYKLSNFVIKGIISNLFGYDGTPLAEDCIM